MCALAGEAGRAYAVRLPAEGHVAGERAQPEAGRGQRAPEGGCGAARPPAAETHAVVGADRVEGVGTAHEKRGCVSKQQHLYKVSALALRWGGEREGEVGVGCARVARAVAVMGRGQG